MSHKVNQEWVAAAYETFEEAIAAGNHELARAVIGDTVDAGFVSEALQMEDELLKNPLATFTHPSSYPNI